MAVTARPYGLALLALGRGDINLDNDTFKVMLTTSGYVPNYDTDEWLTDVTDEITGTGYTAGGETLTGLTWTYDVSDPANKRCVLGANSILWSGATWTGARRLVVYKDESGVAAVSRLFGVIDYGVDKSPANEDFEQTFSAGVFRIKAI